MIKSSKIKQQDDILGRLNPEIMAYGSIAQVHSEVSAAICNVKAREREKQIRAMPDAQKEEFLEKRSENVLVGAKIHNELKSIKQELEKKHGEHVHVGKFAVRREKYAQYTQAGLTTKYNLDRIKRYAFSLLKQDPEKTKVQPNGCITINVKVLEQKVTELENERKARK